MSENQAIGQDNRLLWHLPQDLKHFKALTMGKPVVMGRKTYESIGKPLPGRQNIVLTHARYLHIPGCNVVHSMNETLEVTQDAPEVMIIGGGEIYRLFLPLVTTMHITYVHTTIRGETSFPHFEMAEWEEISRKRFQQDEKHLYDYSFVTLIRCAEK